MITCFFVAVNLRLCLNIVGMYSDAISITFNDDKACTSVKTYHHELSPMTLTRNLMGPRQNEPLMSWTCYCNLKLGIW